MHTAIFKLFPSVVNTVGMSKVQPFSTQSNAPYTLDTYQIHIKLCISIHFYTLFIYAKFQGNQTACTLKSNTDFSKCKKEQSKPPQPPNEEWEKNTPTTYISRMTTAN